MLGLGGVLGLNALGVFELGTIQTGATFVPHRGGARSTLSAVKARSAMSSPRLRSTLTGVKARSEVSDG